MRPVGRGDGGADEDPERRFNVVLTRVGFVVPVNAPLLGEGHQRCGHELVPPVRLAAVVDVDDVVVLAEAVGVEGAVRVVEENGPGVLLAKRGGSAGLLEGGRVLEDEAVLVVLAELVAVGLPLPPLGAAVGLVDEDDVRLAELVAVHGPSLAVLRLLVGEARDLDDLHAAPVLLCAEGAAGVLAVDLAGDAALLELLLELPAQGRVRRNQEDVLVPEPGCGALEVVHELAVVEGDEVRLAAAGGHAEGEPVQAGVYPR